MIRKIVSGLVAMVLALTFATSANAQVSEEEVQRTVDELLERLDQRLERVRQETREDVQQTVEELIRSGQPSNPPVVNPPVVNPPVVNPPVTTQQRPRLGFWVYRDMPPGLGDVLGLDDGVGALVRRVDEGSLAYEAGLRENDVIIAINDVAITSEADIAAAVTSASVGSEMTIRVVHQGARTDLRFVFADGGEILSSQPVSSTNPPPPATNPQPSTQPSTEPAVTVNTQPGQGWLGIRGQAIEGEGFRIIGFADGSPAIGSLEVGDVVVRVGRSNIRGRDDMVSAMEAVTIDEEVSMVVRRGSRLVRVRVTATEKP
ncbi:MAG: PDZ domain-containing protein [Planctomycetes bacterium]|nr:PDZ domain-containing protein [Planctomycetota bacterium]